ncbi:hypothetical protein [Halomonas denitrificans]|nr:hypothetical protein [Halomonas denitrificans]
MTIARWTSRAAAAVLIAGLAAGSTSAPAVDEEPSANRDRGRAMLSGRPGYANRDLFAVEFFAIDGRNISPRSILWVEPGLRTITVRVPEQLTESLINQRRQKWPDYVDIELELEPEHAYEIRGRYNRTDRDNPYEIVVDRVQDLGDD